VKSATSFCGENFITFSASTGFMAYDWIIQQMNTNNSFDYRIPVSTFATDTVQYQVLAAGLASNGELSTTIQIQLHVNDATCGWLETQDSVVLVFSCATDNIAQGNFPVSAIVGTALGAVAFVGLFAGILYWRYNKKVISTVEEMSDVMHTTQDWDNKNSAAVSEKPPDSFATVATVQGNEQLASHYEELKTSKVSQSDSVVF